MALYWFNFLGFLMLFVGLFLNEVVFLNWWYNSNPSLIAVALAYYVTAIWLSLWGGLRRPQT
jgi:hypothetical protein